MMYNEKDFSLPTHCIVHGDNGDIPIPCCCYLPTLKTYTADKTYVGKTKYICDRALHLAFWTGGIRSEQETRPIDSRGDRVPVCAKAGDLRLRRQAALHDPVPQITNPGVTTKSTPSGRELHLTLITNPT